MVFQNIFPPSVPWFAEAATLLDPDPRPRCTTEVSRAAKAAIENTIEYELFIAWQISHTMTRSGYCRRLAPYGLDLIGEAATYKGSCSYTIPF